MTRWLTIKFSQEMITVFIISYCVIFLNSNFSSTLIQLKFFKLPYVVFFLIIHNIAVICLLSILLLLISNKLIVKPLLSFIVIASVSIKYFQQKYNLLLFNYDIFQSVIQTNYKETKDYLNWSMFFNIFTISFIPIFIIFSIKLTKQKFFMAVSSRILWIVFLFFIMLGN
jgi:glucan phosphoethanolaminetransferase (alkaline phosphatase superfamily)